MFAHVQFMSAHRWLSRSGILALVAISFALVLGWYVVAQLTRQLAIPPIKANVPLSFVPDAWQSGTSARYVAHLPGGALSFDQEGVALQLPIAGGDTGTTEHPQVKLGIGFIGASGTATLAGDKIQPGTVNYFIGDDPDQWRTGVQSYGRVTYKALYPGIDLTYEGGSMEARAGVPLLKGTYTVAPGADPSLIAWRYTGVQSTSLDASDNLLISVEGPVAGGDNVALSELAPVAWQNVRGQRVPVQVRYTLAEDGAVRFALGSYNPALPLVIDPVLTYSTYLGGNFAENGTGIAVDPMGNFYVTGHTNSSNFPRVNALQNNFGGIEDAFVAKFNRDGQPVYITYLGGSHWDFGHDIATDAAGNAYVTGYTLSQNFPLANPFQPTLGGSNDTFVAKLNPSGSALLYSTYLGGNDDDYGRGITVDAQGNVYIAGSTNSTNYPVSNAYQPANAGNSDAFVTKFNPAGSALVWSTYLGGSNSDAAFSIAVDTTNNVVITGRSYSTNYPLQAAYQPFMAGLHDVVVTKLNAAGSGLVYSTYFGGSSDEVGNDVALDPAGSAYIVGYTGSANFPVINAFQGVGGFGDAFVAKFTPVGVPAYSTYLGGPWPDGGDSIAVNAAGEAFVIGSTQSDNFPLMNPIYPILRGSEDAFITRFDASGMALIFSTFFGGTNGRELQAQAAIAVDAQNTIYFTGETGANDWPVTSNAFQPFPGSAVDAFVSRISEHSPTPTRTATGSPSPSPTACIVGDYTITEGTGTLVPGTTFVPNTSCNDCTAGMVLPFPFTFYDQTFTQARVSSNGNLQFTSNNHLPFNYCLPVTEYNNAIFAFWDDMYTDLGVYTSISGSAPNRIFNIEWRGTSYNPGPDDVRFEIRLYEGTSGTFEIIYGTMEDDGETATVGVQRDTGSRYTQYACNAGGLTQGLKLTFTLSGCQTPTPQTPTPSPTATATPPTLLYSTYYGSFERDSIDDIAQDAAGNIYVMGTTFQQDINYGDLYVSKFTPNGQQLLWTQIVGGTRIDYGYALAVDPAGNVTIGGLATSFDYPLLNPIQSQHAGGYDGVLTKFSSMGQMIFSTYLGGSGTEYIERMAADGYGNIYIAGHTTSTNFRTTPGAFQTSNQGFEDGFITKLSPDGTNVIWSTYLGGMYRDEAHGLTLDGALNVYLTGITVSPNYPTLNPYQPTLHSSDGDAFVTKMNSEGTGLIYSTYLGGTDYPRPGEDKGQGIVVDTAGHAYVTGFTEAPDFPTTANAFQRFFRGYSDAFVTKLTPAGNQLVYSTLFGGTLQAPYGEDIANDIAVDGAGQAHITGKTYTPDFPIVNAVQPLPGDVYDAFVTKFNASGSGLVYSTYLGGDFDPPYFTGQDTGTGILIDLAGNAVVGGGTSSYNFPVVNAYQYEPAGAGDGFIAKISGSNPVLTPTPVSTVLQTATRTPVITPGTSTPGTGTPGTGTPGTGTPGTSTPGTGTPGTGTPATGTRTPGTGTPGTSTPGTGTPGTSTPQTTTTPCPVQFTDVPPGHTFYSFIRCLACRGIINGYPCGGTGEPCNSNSDPYFRPGNLITRGQLAKIVSQSAGFSEPHTEQTFEDVLPGTAFHIYIERLASRGVMAGYPCGQIDPGPCVPPGNRPYFRPGANATRGQLTKIVAGAAGFSDPAPITFTFTDVEAGSTFHIYVERLLMNRPGVMEGYPCGSPGEPCDNQSRPYFRPNNPLTRGQASKIVSNTFFPDCQTPGRATR